VDEILARALAKAPEDRPATCAELVADLRDAFRGAATRTRIAPPPVVATGAAAPTRRLPSAERPPSRGPSHRALVIGAAAFLAAGAVLAGLLGAVLDDDPRGEARQPRGGTTTTDTQTAETQTTETQVTAPRVSLAEARALNDDGFALMGQGNFEAARPLLARAVARLRGTGETYEAWASYNLAYTRFQLGECGGIIALLDRSEEIQGEHPDIDALRREWDRRCAGDAVDEDDKGNGKGRGRGNGNDD
jgi:hypothetical protein